MGSVEAVQHDAPSVTFGAFLSCYGNAERLAYLGMHSFILGPFTCLYVGPPSRAPAPNMACLRVVGSYMPLHHCLLRVVR